VLSNELVQFRSNCNSKSSWTHTRPIVIAPASTGKDSNNKIAVIKTVQTNKGNLLKVIPLHLIFWIVTIKLIAPAIDEIPAKCKLKIAQSTLAPEWAKTPLSGGYTVHPVPTPDSIKLDNNNKNKAGGNNQKDKLFSLGVELDHKI
jgi:hypothetical protein